MTEQIVESLPSLPQGWIWARLGDLVMNYDGMRVPVKRKEREKMKGIYPYYGASGIIDYVDKYLFDGEFLLIAEDGANLLARSKLIAFQAKGKFWVNNHAHVLKTAGTIPLSFMEHYVNFIDLKFFVTGTAQPKLTQLSMNKIPVPLPPLQEQKNIVAKIEELFTRLEAGVEVLKKARAQLKRYRQSVLKSAFDGKLTEQWRKENKDKIEPAVVLLERIKEERRKSGKKFEELPLVDTSELPQLSEEWVWTSVGELSKKIHYGYTASAVEKPIGPKFLRITDIQHNMVEWDAVPYCKIDANEKTDYLLQKGDIVFTRTGATVGKSYLIRSDIPETVFASYLIRIILSDHVDKTFVYNFFQSGFYWLQINREKIGIGQPNVNGQKLSRITVPLPPLQEQNKIAEEIERLFSIADQTENTIEHSLAHADRLRQSILKQAFEGKLVRQDPTDEPASVLLERIKAEKAGHEGKNKDERNHKVKIEKRRNKQYRIDSRQKRLV